MGENGRIFIDDLEGMPMPPRSPESGPVKPGEDERNAWLRRRNMSADPVAFGDEDPYSNKYVRTDVDETPGTILHYWFGYAIERPQAMQDRMTLWFGGGFSLDRIIAHRFTDIVAKLASGEAYRWAANSIAQRLAAVIALDQFSRNIFRGTPAAFENDPVALRLCMDAIASGDDMKLTPVERWFLYMPLEHSEAASDQELSVEKFAELLAEATPEMKPHFESAYDFAKRHAAVIERFGRFPHRNAILGRESTEEELAFIETTPMGF
ncbi:MAG: DUF924 domain-containing protein [Sphingomonadales bacterium]|nr:MAG: DUF924 domain-containing protein [Sphingomonadales bacterium]